MNIQFRPCTEADLAAVQDHVFSLYRENPNQMEITPQKIQATFQEFSLRPEKGRMIVFEHEGQVIGYAILVFFWSNEFGGDFIEIDELFVQADHRRAGIGNAFFQWLESTWQGKAIALSLQTTPENQGAIAFYQRMGFSLSPNCYFVKEISRKQNPNGG
jgi:GNAT superfamily N-acetyltransferase